MRKTIPYLGLFLTAIMLWGCGPKPVRKVTEHEKVNKEWLYRQMEKSYLWSAELPDMDKTDPTVEPADYFNKYLRYRNTNTLDYTKDTYGDRFSHIEFIGDEKADTRAGSASGKEYDFGFMLARGVNDDNSIEYLSVLYVVPGSPAEKAGLMRGDAFKNINGNRIRSNTDLTAALENATINIEVLNRDTDPIGITKGEYYNYPILFETIYEEPEKTAYLVYNHFTDGGSAGYSAKLKEAFRRFKAAHVENLILDLRYNGGGEINNAQLLASLIVPPEYAGREFMRAESNTCIGKWDEYKPYKFLSDVGADNANIRNLYIITSENTASASELIIHTLRPFYGDNLHVIGQTTRGKNLGSITITSTQYDWEITPMTMRVYNIEQESGYEEGLKPDAGMYMREYGPSNTSYPSLPPLGDYEQEWMLNVVMHKYFGAPLAEGSRWGAYNTGTRAVPGDRNVHADVPQRGLSEGHITAD